jgi:hypothetical protein
MYVYAFLTEGLKVQTFSCVAWLHHTRRTHLCWSIDYMTNRYTRDSSLWIQKFWYAISTVMWSVKSIWWNRSSVVHRYGFSNILMMFIKTFRRGSTLGPGGPGPSVAAQAPQFLLMLFPDGTGLPAIRWGVGDQPPRIFGLEPRLKTLFNQ